VPRRHLDLEGHELPTLSGARQLLQRDKPLLSYEVAVHRHQAHTKALLGYIDSLGYSSFLIEEIAGMTADVRNVLAVPASRLRAFTSSPALTAAYLGNALLPVDESTILLHAFPCCAPKQPCCPGGRNGCCAHWQVHKWIGSVVAQGGADLTFFTRRRWYDQGWKPQLRDRRERTNHVWQIRRPLNMSGMTNDQDVPRAFDVEAETTTGSAFTRAVRESKPRKVKTS